MTAQEIQARLQHPVEIIYNENLREIGLGELEGRSIDEMHEKYPNN